MRNGTWRKALALLLALMMSGCTAQPKAPAATEVAPAAAPAAREPDVRRQAQWIKDAVIYEVNVRQYTPEGTFEAFAEHLPTLKDMGINTLWLMPIHPISQTRRSGTLGSYYSVTDYREVNPEFGTAEDFRALVEQAHAMGFTVMLDWVANHTGWDCPWIREHPDWYNKDEKGNITDPAGMGWPDVADLNYDSEALRAEMIACMKYWVEEFDIDGFRCDYASGVPQSFWEAARRELDAVKPVVMLAEDNSMKSLLHYAFDCNYNWELYDVLTGVAKDTQGSYSIRGTMPFDYPEGSCRLNFLNNHDKNSWEKTILEAYGEEALPSMWALIYTIPGIPLVYTGDEIGLDHKIAFMERDPIDWDSSSLNYRPLLAELSAIRRGNPALYSGSFGGELTYPDPGLRTVFAFAREKDDCRIVCLFNLGSRENEVNVSKFFAPEDTCLLHGIGGQAPETEDTPVGITGKVMLQPWEFYIVSVN